MLGVELLGSAVSVRQNERGESGVDSTDRRIIELLAGNGRLSYAELARQIGLSGPAMHERVGKLEATGVIQAYRAQVDQEAVGLGVTAFIGIVQGVDSEIDDTLERP